MKKSPSDQIIKTLKNWYFLLRNDPETLIQVRTLAMSVVACLVVYYGGSSVMIEPKQEKLFEKQAHRQEIISTTANQVSPALAQEIKNLRDRKLDLQGKLAVLSSKEEFLKEQWAVLSDPERFNRIIFTLSSSAPLNISDDLDQMTLGETRSVEGFEIHPATLTGDGYFQDFLSYLQYLENRPEAGEIDNLVLEGLPGDSTDEPVKVHFSIVVSRVKLKKQT